MATTEFDSNADWKAWGNLDPLWGVASVPGKERGSLHPWTAEEFYENGRREWALHLARWKAYGLDTASCVEIGCGAGRITRQLGETFGEVHGVDVSEGMLAVAMANCTAPNLHFHLTDGAALPLPDGSVSAAFSSFVFQHFDTLEHGAHTFAAIARALRPGGTLFITLPIHEWPRRLPAFSLLWEARQTLEHAHAWARRRLSARGLGKPTMRGLSYPVGWFFDTLPGLGLTDLEVVFFSRETPWGLMDSRGVLARRR